MITNLLIILILAMALEKAFNLRGAYKNIMITVIMFFLMLILFNSFDLLFYGRIYYEVK